MKAEAKKKLAAEEEWHLTAGRVLLHATNVSAFVVMGLELEDAQYVKLNTFFFVLLMFTSDTACNG